MIVDQAVQAAAEQGPKAKAMVGKTVAFVDGVRAYQTKGGVRFQAIVRRPGKKPYSASFNSREEAKRWRRTELGKIVAVDEQAGPGEMTMPELFAAYTAQKEAVGKPLPATQVMMFARLSKHEVLRNLRVSEMDLSKAHEYCS